jgi:hypothetical protein
VRFEVLYVMGEACTNQKAECAGAPTATNTRRSGVGGAGDVKLMECVMSVPVQSAC